MNKLTEGTVAQLDKLIADGVKVERSFRPSEFGEESNLGDSEILGFVNSAAFVVERIAGRDSELHRRLPDPIPRGHAAQYDKTSVSAALGAVVALKRTVEAGFLASLEQRVTANVFDDFLQQAKALVDGSYHPAAAMVMIGGVLEDHLRKACVTRVLTWTGDGSMSKYNDLLHGKMYDKPTWRRIQQIGDIRNDAAHGQFAKVKREDVEDALKYVERFLADYPT